MKLVKICLAICLILSLTIIATPVLASDKLDNSGAGEFAPDRIIVKFKGNASDAMKKILAKYPQSRAIDEIKPLNIQVVKVPSGKVLDMVKQFQKLGFVEYAEPDYLADLAEIPNDPYFNLQWNMSKIRAPQAWDITHGRPKIRIAILDSGIDQNHEDLVGKVVARKNFTDEPTADDITGHGTFIAGIAAAITNNAIGVAGLGYNCSLMNGKVGLLPTPEHPTGAVHSSAEIKAIIWATDPNGDGKYTDGAKVINMSFGGYTPSASVEAAVNCAWNRGAVLVAAAGNDNTDTPIYPASFKNCIAVAATDQDDNKSFFSNFGDWVDVAAPGGAPGIFSTYPSYPSLFGPLNYGYGIGTSYSTPHVAGLAGLLWATKYGKSNASVRKRIESTADKNTGIYANYGIPRIDAFRAVSSKYIGYSSTSKTVDTMKTVPISKN